MAVALHNELRLRSRHFMHSVMADHAMAMMLTLFISRCQDIVVGDQSLFLANGVPPARGEELIGQLVHAGLVAATGQRMGQRTVGLTPLGSARMRAYIDDLSGRR